MALFARTEWAISSPRCGHDLKMLPIRDTSVQGWPLDVRERAEAVHLRLEDPVGVIEPFGDAREPHRRGGKHSRNSYQRTCDSVGVTTALD